MQKLTYLYTVFKRYKNEYFYTKIDIVLKEMIRYKNDAHMDEEIITSFIHCIGNKVQV